MNDVTHLTIMFAFALALITLGTSLVMLTMASFSSAVAVFLLLFTCSLLLLIPSHSVITHLDNY